MASTIYDIGTLLHLKDSLPFVVFNVANLNKHADIDAITSVPPQALNDPSFITTTSNLARPSRRNVNKSSEGTEDSMLGTGTIKRRPVQQHQWHFRRRDSSDRHQPHSAPTGFAAQQAENFQRFYRAVVSPTHVRVTAGGRIVPNTRAPPSWLWNGDKGLFEHQGSIDSHASSFEGLFMQPVQQGHMGSMDGVTEVEYVQQKQPVKLSHPAQFDANKPFMFNNQLVYPVPPGALPISMMGNQHNFAMHPSMFGQPAMPVPLPTMPQHGPGMTYVIPPYSMGDSGLGVPPMLSVADITKSQIQGLRKHLIHIEHQLMHNKHNIDEGFMEKQKKDLKTNIEVMEALLAKQIVQENPSANNSPVKITEPKANHRIKEGGIENRKTTKAAQSTVKSKLTANAPPFQPRAMGGAPYVLSPNAASSFPGPAKALVVQSNLASDPDRSEDSLLKHSQLDWNKVGEKDGHAIPGLPKASTMHAPVPINHDMPSMLKRSSTFHGHSYSIDSQNGPVIAPNALPYLVGTNPSYIAGRETRPLNYQYARPLTEEENRARQLYFGKAPRPVQSGLPRFDGKDFYPPSPVKADTRPATSHGVTTPLRNLHSTPLPRSFENLFNAASGQGSTTHSPVRQIPELAGVRAESHQHEVTSPTFARVQDHVGTTHAHQHTDSYSHLFIEPNLTLPEPPRTPENARRHHVHHMPSGITLVQISEQETLVNDDGDDSGSDADAGIAQGGVPLLSPPHPDFAGRVASFSKPEHQTQFLQRMLQTTTQGPMPVSASSGRVSSVNTQGHLPRYPGTAAASLAPTMSNVPAVSGVMSFGPRKNLAKGQSASSFLPENRPLFERGIDRFTESMDAMSYMRHLAQKSSSNGSKDGRDSGTTGSSAWV